MPHDIRLLTETELRKVIRLDMEVVDCVEAAFAALATGKVVMPPVLSMALHDINAEVDVKTAYVPGFDGFAIKVSPGFFNNPALGLPSLNGLMILLSAKTGLVEAIFLDNGYLTDIRTAAAGAVAAKHLAPAHVETIGIMGTGVQARLQLEAALLVRPAENVLIWGRDVTKATMLAGEISEELGLVARPTHDPIHLLTQSQLVVTTTPATSPILTEAGLHPGLHITAMGSDQEGKNEIAPGLFAEASKVICDRISQCELLGELRSALEAGTLQGTEHVVEIGDIIAGKKAGRVSENDITICDLTGTGVQDTAIATLALKKATEANAGSAITA
ncbi:cyclodeaminase [Rhizobium sp. L1K21]|uniref:cyclodeaminase n=1 Tax=Rhizobium sp. L1K21 TaxID=2954933 RepID=UPI0020930708|nr:cyclodeaminase [Rhizobium sp. L1K21]MCO6185282.1 cyclodeaminase [Rhizobium sp. L1K21]